MDLAAMLEVQLARALRALDMAAMVADTIERQPLKNAEQARVKQAAQRIMAVRHALTAEGIRLPPLRKLGQTDRKYGLGGSKEGDLP